MVRKEEEGFVVAFSGQGVGRPAVKNLGKHWLAFILYSVKPRKISAGISPDDPIFTTWIAEGIFRPHLPVPFTNQSPRRYASIHLH